MKKSTKVGVSILTLLVTALLVVVIYLLIQNNKLLNVQVDAPVNHETPAEPKPHPEVNTSASPSRDNLSVQTLDNYLDALADYNYQYQVDHNHLNSYSLKRVQACTTVDGSGAIYEVAYQSRKGYDKNEFYFVGVRYSELNDGSLSIQDIEDEDEDTLQEIRYEALDEGFECQ